MTSENKEKNDEIRYCTERFPIPVTILEGNYIVSCIVSRAQVLLTEVVLVLSAYCFFYLHPFLVLILIKNVAQFYSLSFFFVPIFVCFFNFVSGILNFLMYFRLDSNITFYHFTWKVNHSCLCYNVFIWLWFFFNTFDTRCCWLFPYFIWCDAESP